MRGGGRIAAAFRRAAEAHPGNEASFRAEAEAILTEVALEHGVSLAAEREVTLSTGRADAIFNRAVVEWEPPGGMSGAREHAGNRHAVQQVHDYVDGLAERDRRDLERLSGVACDGHWLVFSRYRAGHWVTDPPEPVDEASCAALLRTLIAAQSGKALTAKNLLDDFSSQTLRTRQFTRALLEQLDQQLGQHPDELPARLFKEWERIFAVATGVTGEGRALSAKGKRALERVLGEPGADPSRALFCLQTYFALITKLLASLSLSHFVEEAEWDLADLAVGGDDDLLEDMEHLQRGDAFAQAGLANVLEPDLFGWYLIEWSAPVRENLRATVGLLQEYDPSTLQVSPEDTRDLLKDLYQGLLPQPLRHALGQYFTPDWLASMLLDQIGYDGAAAQRILDPSCGTGTFLVLALARRIEQMRRDRATDTEILEHVLGHIVGFDIDPLAALAARANYVLALGPLVAAAKAAIEIPVYRADSMVVPTRRELQLGDRVVLETAAGDFSLPACVETGAELAAVCDLAGRALAEGWSASRYVDEAGAACGADEDEGVLLGAFLVKCRELHRPELGGLWPRLMRNAFMPAFIERFGLVAGNPPWVNWEHLPRSYRERSRATWEDSGMFVHGGMAAMLGSGKKDVSMLMSYVVTDRFLAERGRLGFVVPETLFKTAGAGQGFRGFRVGRDGPQIEVERVRDMVDLKPFRGAANRTAVMTWRRGAPTTYPVPYETWQRTAPRGIGEHATPADVVAATRRLDLAAAPVSEADVTSAWLAVPADLIPAMRKLAETQAPHYQAHAGVYAGLNGAFWLSVDGPANDEGCLPITNLHDIGKRRVPRRHGLAEADLVHPLVRGRDVRRWAATPSAHILFVQDPGTRRGIAESVMREQYPNALEFLSEFEDLLWSRRGLRSVLGTREEPRGPFWSMMGAGEYTLAEHKVVWKDQAADFAAAVLDSDSPSLPNQKVMLVACDLPDEAHFLCALLNSRPSRAFIRAYTIETQISTHPAQRLRLPPFDPEVDLHQELAAASRAAHEAVAAGEEPDQPRVDRAAAALWGLTEEESAGLSRFLDQLLKRDLGLDADPDQDDEE